MDDQPAFETPAEATADRYPDLADILARVQHEAYEVEGPVERVEVTALASGEATYRIWPARADEPVEGYFREV